MQYFKHGSVEDELKRLVLEQNPKVTEFGITAENIKIVGIKEHATSYRVVTISAVGTRGTADVTIHLGFNIGYLGHDKLIWSIAPTLPQNKAKASDIMSTVAAGLGASIEPLEFLAEPDVEHEIPTTLTTITLKVKPNTLYSLENSLDIKIKRKEESDLGKILEGNDTVPAYFDITKPDTQYIKFANTLNDPLVYTKDAYLGAAKVYSEFVFWGLEASEAFNGVTANTQVTPAQLASLNEGLVNMGYKPLDKAFTPADISKCTNEPNLAVGNDNYDTSIVFWDGEYWPVPESDRVVSSLAATQTWNTNRIGNLKYTSGHTATVINIGPAK